jgi:hypothetical protein
MRVVRQIAVVAVVLASFAAAAVAEEWKNPLEHAKVGQWVKYKMQNDMEMKQSIVKVDGKKITIKNEMWMKGTALPANETVVDLDKKAEGGDAKKGEAPKMEDAEVTVNGKKLHCKVQTQNNIKTWMCEEIPVYGVVKSEMDGKPTMELVSWGDKEEAAK